MSTQVCQTLWPSKLISLQKIFCSLVSSVSSTIHSWSLMITVACLVFIGFSVLLVEWILSVVFAVYVNYLKIFLENFFCRCLAPPQPPPPNGSRGGLAPRSAGGHHRVVHSTLSTSIHRFLWITIHVTPEHYFFCGYRLIHLT